MAGKVDKAALIQNLKSQDDGISKILKETLIKCTRKAKNMV